jgi:hypothetical protein
MVIPDIQKIVNDWESNLIDKVTNTDLCQLYQKYGSDKKGIPPQPTHNFSNFYINIFEPLKYENINIFELGLGTNNVNIPSNMTASGKPGASLYALEEYFTQANIYGADIDKDILFNTNRINTFFCDQTNPEIITDMWNNNTLKEKKMDIIIEDGLHTFDASYCFLINSLNKLAAGGIYLGEDQDSYYHELFEPKIAFLKKAFNLSFFKLIQTNNCPLIVAQKKI